MATTRTRLEQLETDLKTKPLQLDPSQLNLVDRSQMIEEINERGTGSFRNRLIYWRKVLLWKAVIGGAKALKRTVDIFGSLFGLIFLSPLFLFIAACIKFTDWGPIFYVSNRVGQHGELFRFPKFRSMVVNAQKLKADLAQQNQHGSSGVTFKMKSDPRITWIGRFIRRASIDELPQLWCVLKGEMSLVGPRPPVPSEVARYSQADRRRLDVIPGLTCIWQVSGRSEIPFDKQVLLDVEYIESQSLWLDIKLLVMTIPAVVFGKGAY